LVITVTGRYWNEFHTGLWEVLCTSFDVQMDDPYTVRGRVERRSCLRQCNRVTAAEQKFRSLTPSHLANTLNSRSESIYYRRRYARAGTSYGPLSICLCPCLSVTSRRSVETDRAGFLAWWLFRPVLHCVIRKFGHLQNKGTSVWKYAPNWTW